MKVSFIMPGRNNRRYAEWSYNSIQKNKGKHEVQICFADDASTDGTWQWCEQIMKDDPNFNAIRNDSGKRLGHTILYDKLVNEVAKHEVCIIWHCDMYLAPGALDAIESHMFDIFHHDQVPDGIEVIPKFDTIVSLTRIEPPLHPKGPEKILMDFGQEPEQFDEEKFLKKIQSTEFKNYIKNVQTEGIFAPWAFFKDTFNKVYGHDELYAPQSKEDSDIFNKFSLLGCKFIQTWQGFVYHLTCRGSRFNPHETTVGINSNEWETQNQKSMRNFIRKWGSIPLHDQYMKPIISPRLDIAIILNVCDINTLKMVEPFANVVYCDKSIIDQYIEMEQPNTLYDLQLRVRDKQDKKLEDINHDIVISLNRVTSENYNVMMDLPQYINDMYKKYGSGYYSAAGIDIKINDVVDYKQELLKKEFNQSTPYNQNILKYHLSTALTRNAFI